jgi:hypothetical protein
MKKWMQWSAALLLASAGTAQAQFELEELEQEMAKPRWSVSVGGVFHDVSFSHSALQHRFDYESNEPEPRSSGSIDYSGYDPEPWKDGDTDGDGYGATVFIGQNNSWVGLATSQMDYKWVVHESDWWHSVQTDRTEVDIAYYKAIEGSIAPGSEGLYGWTLGIRWIEMDQTLQTYERNQFRERTGDQQWKLIRLGYHGVWRPFGGFFKAVGNANFLFGEAEGMARAGNDTKADGLFREDYRNDSSLAYGVNLLGAIGVDVFEMVNLSLGFRGEWLYSFDSTTSGQVVFPDNEDALFIENSRLVFGAVSVMF